MKHVCIASIRNNIKNCINNMYYQWYNYIDVTKE